MERAGGVGGSVGTEMVAIGVVSRPPGAHKEHFCNCLKRFIIDEVKAQSHFYPFPLPLTPSKQGEGVRGRNGIGPKLNANQPQDPITTAVLGPSVETCYLVDAVVRMTLYVSGTLLVLVGSSLGGRASGNRKVASSIPGVSLSKAPNLNCFRQTCCHLAWLTLPSV